MAQTFDSWIKGLGPITQYVLGIVVLLTTLVFMGVIPVEYIILKPAAFTQFQIWRIFTSAFFFGSFSFPWLLTLAMFVSYTNYNESYDFKGKQGDFVWMGILLILANAIGGIILGLFVTSSALLMSLCWVFCKRNHELRMSLYGFEFNAATFPWILLIFHLIVKNNIIEDLLGIFVGHIFFFLRDVMPKTHGMDPLRTPVWFLQYILSNNIIKNNFGPMHPANHPYDARFARNAQQQQQQQRGGRHNWGTGRVLGAE